MIKKILILILVMVIAGSSIGQYCNNIKSKYEVLDDDNQEKEETQKEIDFDKIVTVLHDFNFDYQLVILFQKNLGIWVDFNTQFSKSIDSPPPQFI